MQSKLCPQIHDKYCCKRRKKKEKMMEFPCMSTFFFLWVVYPQHVSVVIGTEESTSIESFMLHRLNHEPVQSMTSKHYNAISTCRHDS
ncbi:hypothetical protein FPOAC1_011623 [Fusarium poae]|uniref:hypothetical protein n=1 Tax=Fusarium poae TaxID=36050 RepID=UPI001CE9ABA6|nr:hypothetical protein FPOAC1_011623 [Fusarium poae]KAG8666805.1 hypothetical protein FPOAC1_011623 [Fusarium poae]